MSDTSGLASRRSLLRFLAASPLLAYGRGLSAATTDELVKTPADALNVFDFEAAAQKTLPPAHWGYLATGVDDDATLRANREGLGKLKIRMRRLVDVRQVDASVELFGRRWPTPIVIAPVGSQRAFHPEGEVATARAAKAKQHLQLLSTVTTTSVEDVSKERGEPVWYQLYPTQEWAITDRLLARAEAAGCPAIVFTVDLLAESNRETQERFKKRDTRQCNDCHGDSFAAYVRRKPMYDGLDVSRVTDPSAGPGLTWEFVRRLRDRTKLKLVLKGIVTAEDARLCVEHGVDAVVVSNHGGRAEESGRGAIESLPEVVQAVSGRIPVLVDGGFRRGTDIFKALALGARAVGIGRPYIWGLAAFGQPGVERVLELLRAELELAMRQTGVTSLAKLERSMIV